MPAPLLAATPGPEERSVDAILGAISAGTRLAALGVTLFEPDGERRNLDQFEPEGSELPAVVFVGETATPCRWIDERAEGAEIHLRFQLWTPGTNWRDRRRLFEAFRRDLGIGDDSRTVYDVLNGIDAVDELRSFTLIDGGGRCKVRGEDAYATVSEVTIKLLIDLI
jgi:hypothetical protein